ncbi:hypothetical protein V1273_003158 [Bradyrhizobium sp. AZCC 1721]
MALLRHRAMSAIPPLLRVERTSVSRLMSTRPNWPSMVCLCCASFRSLSSYRCCPSSRRLRHLINGRRHAGTATASCRAINSRRTTAFQLTPGKIRFRAWRVPTCAPGISILSRVITGTMATGTISVGPAFTAVATMAAASVLAGRARRSGRSGIAANQLAATNRRDRQITSDFPKSCQARESKIFRFSPHPNQPYNFARSGPPRGTYRERHGRWAWNAVDAAASGARVIAGRALPRERLNGTQTTGA